MFDFQTSNHRVEDPLAAELYMNETSSKRIVILLQDGQSIARAPPLLEEGSYPVITFSISKLFLTRTEYTSKKEGEK